MYRQNRTKPISIIITILIVLIALTGMIYSILFLNNFVPTLELTYWKETTLQIFSMFGIIGIVFTIISLTFAYCSKWGEW